MLAIFQCRDAFLKTCSVRVSSTAVSISLYKSQHHSQLSDALNSYNYYRPMTYTDHTSLSVSNVYYEVPTTRFAVVDRACYVAAARTWHSLPFGLTSTSSWSTVQRQLKTLLFTISYPDSFHYT